MIEEWRPFPGWPYEVSSLGRVRRMTAGKNTYAGRILKQFVDYHGYCVVNLSRFIIYQEYKLFTVHRMVCLLFNGNRPKPYAQIRHRDGIKTNNAASNLVWHSHLRNAVDSIDYS
jgi:hypothetical protein